MRPVDRVAGHRRALAIVARPGQAQPKLEGRPKGGLVEAPASKPGPRRSENVPYYERWATLSLEHQRQGSPTPHLMLTPLSSRAELGVRSGPSPRE